MHLGQEILFPKGAVREEHNRMQMLLHTMFPAGPAWKKIPENVRGRPSENTAGKSLENSRRETDV